MIGVGFPHLVRKTDAVDLLARISTQLIDATLGREFEVTRHA